MVHYGHVIARIDTLINTRGQRPDYPAGAVAKQFESEPDRILRVDKRDSLGRVIGVATGEYDADVSGG